MDIMIAKSISGGGGGGGGDLFVVPVTVEDSDQPTYSTDVTLADVKAAMSAGKLVIYNIIGGTYSVMSVNLIDYDDYVTMYLLDTGEITALHHTADGITNQEPD